MRRWKEEDKELVVNTVTLSGEVDSIQVISYPVFCISLHNECSHGLVGFDLIDHSFDPNIKRNDL